MDIETNGALNRLTAAVLAHAYLSRTDSDGSQAPRDAEIDTEQAYKRFREHVINE